MSGGCYNYFYQKINDFVDEMGINNDNRIEFRNLLKLIAKAAKYIEWVDSGDYGPDDENEAIKACFDFLKKFRNGKIHDDK